MKNWIKNKLKKFLGVDYVDRNQKYLFDFVREIKKTNCYHDIHNWDAWSATFCGNMAHLAKLASKDRYRHRVCSWCNIEMPESRHYYEINKLEKNAIEHKDICENV